MFDLVKLLCDLPGPTGLLGFAPMIMLPGYSPVGNICGRVYNNASVGATAFQALGRRNSFDASSRELYGIVPNDVGAWNVPLIPIGLRDRALVFRNALQIMGKVRNSLKSVDLFVDTNPSWCETQHRELPAYGKRELMRWSGEVLLPYLIKCFWWMAGGAITQANFISKLRRDLLQIVSPDDTVALLSNVSSEDEFLSSLGIVAGLDRLRRGQMSREEYVKKYGHRGPHEVEMFVPRPAENPQWIDEQLAGLERSAVDVDTLLHAQRARYEAALQHLREARICFESRLPDEGTAHGLENTTYERENPGFPCAAGGEGVGTAYWRHSQYPKSA